MNDKVFNVKMFHYQAWPDFGIPDNPEDLIDLILKVKSFKFKRILVHCSAGVGRTGILLIPRMMAKMEIPALFFFLIFISHFFLKKELSLLCLNCWTLWTIMRKMI